MGFMTDAVLADLLNAQQWTSFRFEAAGSAPRDPGADQIRFGGLTGEGIGVETSLRLVLAALGDFNRDSTINHHDIDLLAAAINDGPPPPATTSIATEPPSTKTI